MDALSYVPGSATLDTLHLVPRTAKQTCYHDKNGHLVCKKESFFHRVGRYILIAVLIVVALLVLCCLCCCLKRRKKKDVVVIDQGGAPPAKKGGIMGMLPFGKKNKTPEYNLETANHNGAYGPPR